jgi:hypothetical protein
MSNAQPEGAGLSRLRSSAWVLLDVVACISIYAYADDELGKARRAYGILEWSRGAEGNLPGD